MANAMNTTSFDKVMDTFLDTGDIAVFDATWTVVPMEILIAEGEIYQHDNHLRNYAILMATFSILSVISSCLIIRMIAASKTRFSTTYHRLMLGVCAGDILYSLPSCFFNIWSPREMEYMVWNARGSQTSCSVTGFIVVTGIYLTWFYSCSLNLFYLSKVKYNKTDTYIRKKIEPWLHGVPISIALAVSIYALVKNNYNDGGSGTCVESPEYWPRHCWGYAEGEIREGFTIPCGRGHDTETFTLLFIVSFAVPPVVICVSLGMLYRFVSKQEKSNSRYGAGSFTAVQASNSNRDNSNSRAVLHRALGYTGAYFMTWGWVFAAFIMRLAGGNVPIVYTYFWTIFNSSEGLFNLLIFLHPKVACTKRTQNLSWPRAFTLVLRSGLVGVNNMESTRKKTETASTISDSKTRLARTSSMIALGRTVGTKIRSELGLGTKQCKPSGIKGEKADDGTQSALFRDEVLPELVADTAEFDSRLGGAAHPKSCGDIEEDTFEENTILKKGDLVENIGAYSTRT